MENAYFPGLKGLIYLSKFSGHCLPKILGSTFDVLVQIAILLEGLGVLRIGAQGHLEWKI